MGRRGHNAKTPYEVIEKEMVARGIEISQMIKIFLAIRHMLPEGTAERIEKIAEGYAERNDTDRGSVPKCIRGRIDFYDEGLRPEHSIKIKAERFNEKIYKCKA